MTSLTHYFTVFIAVNLHGHRTFPVGGVQVQSFDVNFYIFYFSKGGRGSVPK